MESNHLFKEIIYIFIIFKMVSMITAGDVLIDHFKQYFHGTKIQVFLFVILVIVFEPKNNTLLDFKNPFCVILGKYDKY